MARRWILHAVIIDRIRNNISKGDIGIVIALAAVILIVANRVYRCLKFIITSDLLAGVFISCVNLYSTTVSHVFTTQKHQIKLK